MENRRGHGNQHGPATGVGLGHGGLHRLIGDQERLLLAVELLPRLRVGEHDPHMDEPVTPPAVLPARAPPQAELGFEPADRPAAQAAWPEIDQTGGQDSRD